VSGKVWRAIDVVVAAEAREAIEYGLMEAGALGTETVETNHGRAQVIGYFEAETGVETVRQELLNALQIHSCAPTMLIDFRAREVADQDWLTEWKKHWQPVEVGRFVIAPPWFDTESLAAASGLRRRGENDHILIRINPGMAFGTGTHETTRLCLKALEKYFAGGSFLDVGTGTGILAIAAAKLAVDARVVAYDTDADAVEIAKDNARLNDIDQRIDFRVGCVDEHTASADLVCANLTAPVIVELLSPLLSVTCGRLVLSGILDSQFEMVNRRLMQLAASVNEVMQDGEWLALVI